MKRGLSILVMAGCLALLSGVSVSASEMVPKPPVVPRLPNGVAIAVEHLRQLKADERLIADVEQNLAIALANGAGVKAVADIMEYVSVNANRPQIYVGVSEQVLLMAAKGRDLEEVSRQLRETPAETCPVRVLLEVKLLGRCALSSGWAKSEMPCRCLPRQASD